MPGDIPRTILAALGWTKDAIHYSGAAYLAFVRRSILPSSALIALGSGLVWLSAHQGNSAFNAVGVGIVGLVFFFWIVIAQPVVESVSILGDHAPPVRRIIGKVFGAFFFIVALTLVAVVLPPGLPGAAGIVIILIFIFGLTLLGLSLSRRAIGVKVLVVGTLLAFNLVLPQTMGALGDSIKKLDRQAASALSSNPEIVLTLAAMEGADESTPMPFIRGEPNWYCRPDATSGAGFKCYENEGFDSYTRQRLTAVSPEMLTIARANLHEAQRAAEEEAARIRQEREREQAEEAERVRLEKEAKEAGSAERAAKEARLRRDRQMAAEAAALKEWESFDAEMRAAPQAFDISPQWPRYLSGKNIAITYTARRAGEALEVAKRLTHIGANVSHERVHVSSNQYSSEMTYPFQEFEVADAARAAVVQVVRIDLQSMANGPNRLIIKLN